MASGTVVVIPSNRMNIIQTDPGLSSAVLQASGAIPNLLPGAQQLGTSTSASQQVPPKGRLEKFLNAEAKVLGAIQIMVGLIHIGFGGVAICLASAGYIALSVMGGYSFWGGILFICSGSLSISAAKKENRSLVKCSVGMNITSAVMASFGIVQYILELSLGNYYFLHSGNTYWIEKAGICLSSVLLLFRLLEFFIAVSLAHFGCQATCCANDQEAMVFVPYQVNAYTPIATESNLSSPPAYDNVVTQPK